MKPETVQLLRECIEELEAARKNSQRLQNLHGESLARLQFCRERLEATQGLVYDEICGMTLEERIMAE